VSKHVVSMGADRQREERVALIEKLIMALPELEIKEVWVQQDGIGNYIVWAGDSTQERQTTSILCETSEMANALAALLKARQTGPLRTPKESP